MDRQTHVELLQRYRRDRRELLSFLLSGTLLKKIVMPPGAVSLDDIDLDQVSVDHILDCARKGGTLELSDAIRRYHDELNMPPLVNSGLGDVYFLVTNPEMSGPPPARIPPPLALTAPVPIATVLSKSLSLQSAQSQAGLVDDEIDDFEDGQDEDEPTAEITRRQLNDASDLILSLPPFATGLSEDDLRETAYEVLLVSVGAAGGLISPAKEKKEEKKSKLVRKFTRSKTEKHKPQPTRAPGLAGLMDTMRTQMEISEASDRRTREALLHASAGRVGKRMDTLLVPLELLCCVSRTEFPDRKIHLRWQKRQLNLMEEGLIYHPAIGMDRSDRITGELRSLITKLEEAEVLPSPAGPAQHAEALKAMRGAALTLAERAGRGDQTGEVCHWADGYHLNVRLYEKLLCSVFDILDEGQLVEDAEEILELLKSTWRVLGITQTVHDTCYTWVLFRQHATHQMKRIASDGQRSTTEKAYMKALRSVVEGSNGPQEFSFVQSVLIPIKLWTDRRLDDYHLHFTEATGKMEALVTVAMVAGRLIADENEQTGVTRLTSTAEVAAVAKQAEDYIWSSVKNAYERALEAVDSKSAAEHHHPLALLAEDIQELAKRDASIFAPILSRWQPQALAVTSSLLHTLYHKELKPFLDGVSQLTDDVASVLPAADSLEQYLMSLVAPVEDGDSGSNIYKQQMVPYQVEVVSGTLIMRWVNSQLSRLSEWVERTTHQEKWDALSPQQRYGESIVEVFRIIEETVDQFFGLKLPMRMPLVKGLTNGLDNALQLYSKKVLSQLGDKADLIPPAPSLTRYKKDTVVRALSKKKVADPRLPDEKRSSEINMLTIAKLCVRLNTLHYILSQLDVLEDNIRQQWAMKRPQNHLKNSNGTLKSRNTDGDLKLKANVGSRPLDELSSAFDGSRNAANVAIDKICEFTGMKVIFWDMRELYIDGLYKGGVSQSRMEKVVNGLDPVLGQLCEVINEPLRDRVVLGLLQASMEGFVRVLLDGGPFRGFGQTDIGMLEEDLHVLKDFFIADGDGLPRGVVENMAASVQQILTLYSLETYVVIESFRRASEQMVTGTTIQKEGLRSASDADALLRVLCHRTDPDASKFLKKQYKLPKTTA
ncbi:hypothetical protein O6H91_13G060800 [Diphasiastrum complanatum]|uniref:Uncharacterized protein n=1 Tax=Diphasiastrum complanatum TaxID=34168 RepID=A0ACC2BVS1_DIPCM|nr:hypothetical protein O6H91_13G060800 [Diphasiastrum complanatum]